MYNGVNLCQLDTSSSMRLYLASGKHVTRNVYGIGIGYPQRRSDGIVLKQNEKHL